MVEFFNRFREEVALHPLSEIVEPSPAADDPTKPQTAADDSVEPSTDSIEPKTAANDEPDAFKTPVDNWTTASVPYWSDDALNLAKQAVKCIRAEILKKAKILLSTN